MFEMDRSTKEMYFNNRIEDEHSRLRLNGQQKEKKLLYGNFWKSIFWRKEKEKRNLEAVFALFAGSFFIRVCKIKDAKW